MTEQQPPRSEAARATLLDYLRLFRLPNVFTAISDILMGFSLADPHWRGVQALPWLVLASACLYTAGMVWNDVFDIDQDSRERPTRPLPSGKISLAFARGAGLGLLLAGLGFAVLAGATASQPHSRWLAPATACALVVLILGYDGWLKRTAAGPIAMGACRVANVLLACSLAPTQVVGAEAGGVFSLGWTPDMLGVALAIGVYIAGVTWMARREAGHSKPAQLTAAVIVMVMGLALLAALPWIAGAQRAAVFRLEPIWWVAFVLLLGATIVRRCLPALLNATPRNVQAAVKFSILSLITLDAAVTLLCGASPWMGVAVVALAAPALILGRWVYST